MLRLGKDFIHQFKFKDKYLCDFCFPDEKIIIETYGDYWHCNPEIYPNGPKNTQQIRCISKDKSREAYIRHVDNGSWKLITLWEADINNELNKCIDKIEETLGKKIIRS